MRLKEALQILKDTANEWNNDNASSHGAALAYYTVFSLPSLLLIAISVAAFVFGQEASRGQIVSEFQGLFGQSGAQVIQAMIESVSKHGKSTLAGIVGIVILFFGASGVFLQLQTSLNTMWGVKPKPQSSVLHFLFTRLLSFAMVLSIGFLLLVSLIISSLLSAFGKWLASLITGSPFVAYVMHAANLIIDFAAVTLLFALMYKYLPDVKIRWRDVWFGAIVTAVLFSLGKYLIGLYLGHSTIASSYGAAGSLALILVWIYYSSQIFFFGAEFTKLFANRYGAKIEPAKHAVLIQQKEVKGGNY